MNKRQQFRYLFSITSFVGLFSVPAMADFSESDAIENLVMEVVNHSYHDTSSDCLLPKSSGLKNAGYTIELFDICTEDGKKVLLSRWRVDQKDGSIYQQNETGKYVAPSSFQMQNILSVQKGHPYYWIKFLLSEKIPQIPKWQRTVKKDSNGASELGIHFEDFPIEPSAEYYEIALGEDSEDHWVTWDTLVINRLSKQIWVKSRDGDERIPLEKWDRLKSH